MKNQIDSEKLANLITQMASEVRGPCSQSAACIGVIDGKQIQLRIVGELDDDDFLKVVDKFTCFQKPKKR